LTGPGKHVAELLQGTRIDVPLHQLEVLVSLFYSTIDDVYIGVDSHLPSRFLRVHPFLLENLAASEGPSSVALGGGHAHAECHAARWVRIVPHSLTTLKRDFAEHPDIAHDYFARHDEHGITLLSVEPDETSQAHEDILRGEWTTDLGLWVNTCVLLFEPSIQATNKELRLQLIYPTDRRFDSCQRYVRRLIEHATVVKCRGNSLVSEALTAQDKEHLLWGLDTMFQPRLADNWDTFVLAHERVRALGPFVEKYIKQLSVKKPKILDAATGIGCDSLYLLQNGYDVTSNEIEHKFITYAREAAEAAGVSLELKRYDWRHFEYLASAQTYDVILAFGNSLSCLQTEADVRAVIARFEHLLRPGGVLIVDERNYPMIFANQQEMLKRDFRFPPNFPYCGTSIQARPRDVPKRLGVDNDLLTLEYDRTSDGEPVGTFDVLPFAEGQVRELLEDTGFTSVQSFYNLREPNGSKESSAFVTYVARRRGGDETAEFVIAFTDVTKSMETKRVLGDSAYASELKKHKRKVEIVVAARGGIIRNIAGDGHLVSFAEPLDAVEAMKEIVTAPGTTKLKVRAGINIGVASEDASGDLGSRAVDVAKRICDEARPNLLVVDDRVRLATLSERYRWKPRGQVHLQVDLEDVERRTLWQLDQARG